MDMTYDVKDLAKKYPDVEKLRVGNLRRAWRNIVIYELAVFAVVLLSLGYIGELYDTAVRNSEGTVFLVRSFVVLGLLILLPPWFFASTKRLLEKTRQGEVTWHVFQKRVSDIERGGRTYSSGKFVWSTYISLVYKDEDGKNRKLTFLSKADDVLQVGTELVKYRGLPYPIPV